MVLQGIQARLLGLVLATVLPFTALLGGGLWVQWRSDQAVARERVVAEARLLGAQVDDHLSTFQNLLVGLARALSTNPADAPTNDSLLRRGKRELPSFTGNIFLFSLDGTNIGLAEGERFYAGDRTYFQDIVAGHRFSIGQPVRGRSNGQWVIGLARPVEDEEGRLQAVIGISTLLEHFQDAFRVHNLPSGGVFRITNQDGIVIAQSDDTTWIGRDLSKYENVAKDIRAGQ